MRDADGRLLLKIIRRQEILPLGAEGIKIAPYILRTAEKIAPFLRARFFGFFRWQSQRKSGDGRENPKNPRGLGENTC